MTSKSVVVLSGGVSKEREVSLVSGQAICKALEDLGHKVYAYDFDNDITKFMEFIKALQLKGEMCSVFNALHGTWGEDGRVQAVMDFLKVPYTHSGVSASGVCMDKCLSKHIAKSVGINTIRSSEFKDFTVADVRAKISPPCVIKPVSQGSSCGVFICKNEQQLEDALRAAQGEFNHIMVEDYISNNRELTVGVLNNESLEVTEIIPKSDFYDFSAKYDQGGSVHVVPAEIDPSVATLAKNWALLLHQAIGCNGVSRVDFLLDENNVLYMLEINNQPGMTPTSLLPEQARARGIEFGQLCEQILSSARCGA